MFLRMFFVLLLTSPSYVFASVYEDLTIDREVSRLMINKPVDLDALTKRAVDIRTEPSVPEFFQVKPNLYKKYVSVLKDYLPNELVVKLILDPPSSFYRVFEETNESSKKPLSLSDLRSSLKIVVDHFSGNDLVKIFQSNFYDDLLMDCMSMQKENCKKVAAVYQAIPDSQRYEIVDKELRERTLVKVVEYADSMGEDHLANSITAISFRDYSGFYEYTKIPESAEVTSFLRYAGTKLWEKGLGSYMKVISFLQAAHQFNVNRSQVDIRYLLDIQGENGKYAEQAKNLIRDLPYGQAFFEGYKKRDNTAVDPKKTSLLSVYALAVGATFSSVVSISYDRYGELLVNAVRDARFIDGSDSPINANRNFFVSGRYVEKICGNDQVCFLSIVGHEVAHHFFDGSRSPLSMHIVSEGSAQLGAFAFASLFIDELEDSYIQKLVTLGIDLDLEIAPTSDQSDLEHRFGYYYAWQTIRCLEEVTSEKIDWLVLTQIAHQVYYSQSSHEFSDYFLTIMFKYMDRHLGRVPNSRKSSKILQSFPKGTDEAPIALTPDQILGFVRDYAN